MALNLNNYNIDSMPYLDAYLFSMWKAKAVRAFLREAKKTRFAYVHTFLKNFVLTMYVEVK